MTKKNNATAKYSPAADKRPNQSARQILTDLACIATLITAMSVIIPANAQAMVTGGYFGETVKKTIHKDKADSAARPLSGENTNTNIVPASLGGLARSLPADIYKASPTVVTSCFNARMISLLSTIQRKYNRPVIITSGYRGIVHNIRAGGVRGSLHTACAAADIKVSGINKYQLASFVRTLPNRGGIGLYCHQAVHVDIGKPRDWNWCTTRKH